MRKNILNPQIVVEPQIGVGIATNAEIQTQIQEGATIKSVITSGARGRSAYEEWLESGYSGTPEDFFAWLRQSGYVHIQMVSSSVWEISHGLGKYPSVTIVDSANSVVIGDIQYVDVNALIVSFAAGFSGKAYLN